VALATDETSDCYHYYRRSLIVTISSILFFFFAIIRADSLLQRTTKVILKWVLIVG
jgi:hypothetical protein